MKQDEYFTEPTAFLLSLHDQQVAFSVTSTGGELSGIGRFYIQHAAQDGLIRVEIHTSHVSDSNASGSLLIRHRHFRVPCAELFKIHEVDDPDKTPRFTLKYVALPQDEPLQE